MSTVKDSRNSDALNIDAGQLRIFIRFMRSHSQYYDDAVEIARELPNYRTKGADKDLTHEVDISLTIDNPAQWERVRQLASLIGGWKRSDITITGASASTFSQLERDIVEVRQCYTRRCKSGLDDRFCSGKTAPDDEKICFGCQLIKGVSRDRSGYRYTHLSWFQFGALSDDLANFSVDKDEVFRI